jgi:hypothetical protein
MGKKHLVRRAFVAIQSSAIAISLTAPEPVRPPAAVPPGATALRAPTVLNDDGGWCWFQDERALVVAGRGWSSGAWRRAAPTRRAGAWWKRRASTSGRARPRGSP